MKYYIDTEFIEGFHKPLFGKKRHFIDLISLDDVADKKDWYYGRDIWSNTRKEGETDLQHDDKPATREQKLTKIKEQDNFPKQKDEHNALSDAKWNMDLHKFIEAL